MLIVVAVLMALILLAVIVFLVRQSDSHADSVADSRLEQMLAADLPAQLARLEARFTALENQSRGDHAQMRADLASEAQRSRDGADKAAAALRTEVLESIQSLGKSLNDVLADSREVLQARLGALAREQAEHQEKLRDTMQRSLDRMNTDNSAKLEKMRETVDEKLQKTLNARLTESFGQVTTHLGEVQKGLGEMKELATGVGDLKKVLTNVKARGVVGEFQLGQQLEQMFSPEQYIKNARIKPDTVESVEYALKFPNGPDSTVLLSIDAKFPREDWERLEHAYERGSAEEIASAGNAFERAIRAEGKRICEKYIDPPTTLPHAVMFLPTEGLYAEVVRRPGLQSELQQQCRVTIAGPSTFMAILTSFQMGFHTLAIEKKGNEVWNVLGRVRNEFEKFGGLMEKVEKNVGTVQKTLKEIRGKTTTINRQLKSVASLDGAEPDAELLMMGEVMPLLAATADEE